MLFHPDNPRILDAHARAKLKKIIQKRGFVGGIVWNERTGRLVGGHQRILVMDELEGSQDYSLEVDIIDVDETREKELLIALNNPAAQGVWDTDKLEELVPQVDLSIVGFDQLDMEALFPDRTDFAAMFADDKESPSVLSDAEEIQRMKAERKRYREQEARRDDAGFQVHLVFASADEASCFLDFAGCAHDMSFVDGRMIVNGVGGSWDELWGAWCERHKENTNDGGGS